MADFSVDDTGVSVETLKERVDKFNAALQDPANYGPGFSVDPSEAIPMVCAIVAEPIVALQAGIKAAVDATVPGSARGTHADDVGALTDTKRLVATKSTIPLQLNGNADETIPTGRQFTDDGSGTSWVTTEAVVLNGSGVGTTIAEASTTGPIHIGASTAWTIVLGDANLTSVQSTGASTPGRNVEDDESYEARRQEEIGGIGKATLDAIQAGLTATLVPLGATSVRVAQNTSSVVVDGRPPKSIEVIVDDGGSIADTVIAAAIWAEVAGGIETHGAVTSSADDATGKSHTVKFTRVATVTAWIRVTVDNTDTEVAIPDKTSLTQAIKDAVVAKGNLLRPGRDVIPGRYAAVAFGVIPNGQAVAVTAEQSIDGATWYSTVLSVDDDEAAEFAAARVSVIYSV